MGLDVTAYRGLVKLDVLFDDDGEPVNPATREAYDHYFKVYANPDFPGREAGLESRAVYSYTDATRGWSGGYGRYNGWREQLAKLAGYAAAEEERYGHIQLTHCAGAWAAQGGPFWELISFSDCEGTIGPIVSAKLAKDFADFDDRAKEAGSDFYERYAEWLRCFEMAADGGAVRFH